MSEKGAFHLKCQKTYRKHFTLYITPYTLFVFDVTTSKIIGLILVKKCGSSFTTYFNFFLT